MSPTGAFFGTFVDFNGARQVVQRGQEVWPWLPTDPDREIVEEIYGGGSLYLVMPNGGLVRVRGRQ